MTDYFNASIKLETVGSLTSSGSTITNENSTNIVIHKNISSISDTLTITKEFNDGTISYTLLDPSAIRDTNNNNFKTYILNLSVLLVVFLNNIQNIQEMNEDEYYCLKKIIFKRIGYATKFLRFYRFLPSFLFKIIFYILSPLYITSFYKMLSKVHNNIRRL